MKRTIILSIFFSFAFIANAQWSIKTYDNGFDDPQYDAVVTSNDKNAKLALAVVDNNVVLAAETPDIWYRNNKNSVIITFKINGENKEYKLDGWASSKSNMIMFAPKGDSYHWIDSLMQNQFLADFKNASLMKLQIIYGSSYEYETYVFKMTGSTAAYKKVSSQVKPELKKKQEISMQTTTQQQTTTITEREELEDEIYTVVEIDPEFPGGVEAMHKYIADNLSYPMLARENHITGRVYITFIVEKDGSISNVKTLRDIGGGCGAEACRIVRSMPNWKPGKQRGKAVRVQYNLPINFSLN